MLKFQTLIAAGIGTVLLAPRLGEERLALLENALTETTRALEVLAGIREMAGEGEAEAVGLIRTATEAPILDPRRRDDRLMLLRNEVSLLQTELDAIVAAPEASPAEPAVPSMHALLLPGELARTSGFDAMRPLTTGLSQTLLDSLTDDAPGAVDEDAAAGLATGASDATKRAPQKIDAGGYTADIAGMARVCFRAGRWAEGIQVVPQDTSDAEALYWRARCLEKLERLDEALAALRRVEELAGADAPIGLRATNQVTFLEWRLEFRRRTGGTNEGAPR